MAYQYGKEHHGRFVDGHEQEDVIAYCKDVFLPLWTSIEDHMKTWTQTYVPSDPEGMPIFPNQKHIVLVTHDESTFYANDCSKTRWVHSTETAVPVRKGEGASLMISDFCSLDLGWLKSKDNLVTTC